MATSLGRGVPPVPTTPRKTRGSHTLEIDQFVKALLNDEYGVGITVPDLHLSPKKRQQGLRTEEDVRVERIHGRIRWLRYQNPDALSGIRDDFHSSAKTICTKWLPKPRADRDTLPRAGTLPKASSAEERRDLQLSLLSLLETAQATPVKSRQLAKRDSSPQSSATPNENSPLRNRPSKRSSDEFGPQSSAKRPKSRSSSVKTAHTALDEVPVRAKVGSTSFASNIETTPSRGRQLAPSLGPPLAPSSRGRVADSVSTGTSRQSFHSAIFDQTTFQEPDSQTTVAISQEFKGSNYRLGVAANQSFYIPEPALAVRSSISEEVLEESEPGDFLKQGGPTSSEEQAFLEIEEAGREPALNRQSRDLRRLADVLPLSSDNPPSLASGKLTSSGKYNPTSSEERALREASFQYDARHSRQPAQGSSSFSGDNNSKSDQYTVYSSIPDIVDADPSQPVIGGASAITPKQTFDERLECVWPQLPGFLTNAPLPIIWEVTRAAIHCGVSLDTLDMRYEDSWHSQNKFHQMLKSHPAFKFKDLPGPCDKQAWRAAFTSFQHNGRAVTLSIDAKFNPLHHGPLLKLSLQPLKFDLGHRLSRRWGSDRFLEFNLPSPTSRDVPDCVKNEGDGVGKIIRWLAEGSHTFLGRIWAPFFTRDAKKTLKEEIDQKVASTTIAQERIYFFAEDGNDFEIESGKFPPKAHATMVMTRARLRLSSMLDWAINISHPENKQQTIMKLFSRLALSLSRTNPTVVLQPSQMYHRESDVRSPSRKVMNDGIARMSRGLAQLISQRLGLDVVPSGFQGRLGPAKGFWVVDVETYADNDGSIWIETYPSQRKWVCDYTDKDHRTFEVKFPARELKSASLNQQFIPVLEDRARDRRQMRDVIRARLLKSITEDLEAQREALDNAIMFQKWVYQSLSKTDRIMYGQVPFVAGLPKSDGEALKFLLDGGFDPKKLLYMRQIAESLAKQRCEKLKSKLNIQIAQSTYAYMVVDFTGVLKEGEVHFGFSSHFESDEYSDTLLHDMDVLVARAPAHFVSDIQKVRAVFKPELRCLKDVIVFSSQGNTPLADLLSGGDYDGDQAWVCWDAEIVDNFENAAPPPQPDLFKKGYLRKETGTFEELLRHCHNNMDHAANEFVRRAFAFNMQQQLLGICTKYKEKICYRNNNVSDKYAVTLSTLVGKLVDQGKQGIVFHQPDWANLRKREIGNILHPPDPAYMTESFREVPGEPIHILDFLKFKVAKPAVEDALRAFGESVRGGANQAMDWDKDLAYYFDALEHLARNSDTYRKLRDTLSKDLYKVRALWTKSFAGGDYILFYPDKVESVYHAWLNVRPDPECLRKSVHIKTLLLGAHDEQPDSVSYWGKLKASVTFKLFYRKPKFVFRVAGMQLQQIKAERCAARSEDDVRAPTAIIPTMYAIQRPDNRIVHARIARDEAAGYAESVAGWFDETFLDEFGDEVDDA